MRVLVTGGSGFIGSHVVDKLIERGVTARVFDLIPPSYAPKAEYYQGSILSVQELRAAMAGCDAVMHLAAVADVKAVYEDPHYSEEINVRGTSNVLEAMRKSDLKRIVYGSTTWVYSDTAETEVDEDTQLGMPSHLYTATKLAGESYVKAYAELYGLETTVLRYGIPYGPRARSGAVVPIFVNKAMAGDALTIQGDGLQFRNFVYVEDLAVGNVLALKPVAIGKTYNLDGTQKVTIKEIAETVAKIVGNTEIEYVPARPGDFSGKEIDSSRALNDLGWSATTSFEDGVKSYVEWVGSIESNKTDQWATVSSDLL
jgi:UDP-glucose 4-epimerase